MRKVVVCKILRHEYEECDGDQDWSYEKKILISAIAEKSDPIEMSDEDFELFEKYHQVICPPNCGYEYAIVEVCDESSINNIFVDLRKKDAEEKQLLADKEKLAAQKKEKRKQDLARRRAEKAAKASADEKLITMKEIEKAEKKIAKLRAELGFPLINNDDPLDGPMIKLF